MKKFLEKNMHWFALLALALGLMVVRFGMYVSNYATQTSLNPINTIETAAVTPRSIREGTAPPPPLREVEQASLEAMPAFQHLISYTGAQFEPHNLAIAAGETIRITNNSNASLWIAPRGIDGQTYPANTTCGLSALDSCEEIPPQSFWQVTLDEPGNWGFTNVYDQSQTGTIVIQVMEDASAN